jgi:hypothetical protein
VLRVDPESNQVIDRLEVTVDRNAHTNVVYAGGSVWVSSDTTLLSRLDPDSGTIDEFDVAGGVPFLEHEGFLWVRHRTRCGPWIRCPVRSCRGSNSRTRSR